jgi:hypothetical protein
LRRSKQFKMATWAFEGLLAFAVAALQLLRLSRGCRDTFNPSA